MKYQELQNKTLSEAFDKLNALKKEALSLRFQKANNQLEKPSEIRRVRKDVAKVETRLSQLKKEIRSK